MLCSVLEHGNNDSYHLHCVATAIYYHPEHKYSNNCWLSHDAVTDILYSPPLFELKDPLTQWKDHEPHGLRKPRASGFSNTLHIRLFTYRKEATRPGAGGRVQEGHPWPILPLPLPLATSPF